MSLTDEEKRNYLDKINNQLRYLDFVVYDGGCCCIVARRKLRVTDKLQKISWDAYTKGVYTKEQYIRLQERADNVIHQILCLYMICQRTKVCEDPLKWKNT